MATISTIHDISRALRENPEWREEIRSQLLTAELLALPDSHAALTTEVRALTARMDDLTVRVDALTARVDALTVEVRALTARMDDLTVRVDALTARVDALTEEVRALTAKVDAFVEATNRRLDSLEEGQRRLEKRMDRMQYRLDRLWGSDLEAQLHNKLPTPVRREFDVRHPRPVWAARIAGIRGSSRFEDDVDAASDAGKITENEETRLRVTDLIMRARRNSDGATIWFAVEASGVINIDDIDRARQSADAITKVYEQDAVPIVYGYRISDHQRRQAHEQGVHVFIDPDGD